MVPTYLPTSRHLGFEGLGADYPGADYGLRGWDLGAPQAPPAPPVSGGWATASTSPPQAPHTVEEADRSHEDSKSGVLSQFPGSYEGQAGQLGAGYEAEMAQHWRMALGWGEGGLHLPYLPPTSGGTEGKMSMEGGAGGYNPARPQSSTSLSPPSHLAAPQPINPRLPNNMLALNGGVRKYQCKMCPQAFHSKADLQLHTQIHLREPKPYKCASCGKAFANSSYLSQHTRIHLGIKPYRCEICQRKFTQLSHLQQHIRTHTGDKPYKCRVPGCTKAFSQLSNLQSHSRCHQTDKPYKCNSCYKCFSDEQSLFEHIPKHKESKHIKTHICSYCGKSYTQETYLAKHMQKHADRTDKRPPIIAGPSNMANDLYWPKMDPGLYQGHDRLDPYGQGLMDPSRFHQQFAEDLRHQGPYGMGGGWGADPSKASSAFSPINSGLGVPTSTGFNMGGATRGYPFYDPISFQRQSQVGFESKTAGSNLISLSQIKNYAHDRGGPPTS